MSLKKSPILMIYSVVVLLYEHCIQSSSIASRNACAFVWRQSPFDVLISILLCFVIVNQSKEKKTGAQVPCYVFILDIVDNSFRATPPF